MRRIRTIAFAIVCILTIALAVTAMPTRVFASTDYGVQLTNELRLGGVGDPQTCMPSVPDMAGSWQQIMQDSDATTPYSYQNTWNWSTDYDNARAKLTDFVTRFRSSLNSSEGTGWAISQTSLFDSRTTSNDDFETFHKMIRIWAFDPDTTFTLEQGQLVPDGGKAVYYTDFFLNPGAGCRWQAWNYAAVSATVMPFMYDKFLLVNAKSISYPGDYTGQPIPSAYIPPAPTYVAMGDSYSSGEGVLPYEDGTDTGADSCHRSVQAYPRLLQNTMDLGPTAFVACSGAISDYIINEYNQVNVEPPEASYMSTATSLVTISIGGNDVGFPHVISTCTGAAVVQDCLDAIQGAASKVSDPAFLSKVEGVLSGIRALGNSETEVVVVGYPQLFPAYADMSGSCTWGNEAEHLVQPDLVSGQSVTEEEVDALREVHDALNGVIETAVNDTNDSHVHFVDPTATFNGHEICGTLNEWVNEISLTVNNADIASGSFHPNTDGQIAYAQLIDDEIRSFD